MKKAVSFLVILINIMVLIIGCKDVKKGPETPITPPAEQKEQPAAPPSPVSGGLLTISMPSNPDTLNPLTTGTKEMVSLLSLVFESLIRYDENEKPQPYLAESWDIDSSNTTWTFHLRKGVKWQKINKEFTAADVVFTLDFLTSKQTESKYKRNLSYIQSYTAVDAYTLVIRTTTPFCGILNIMTFPILSKDYYEGKVDNKYLLPIGTGPYQVDQYNKMNDMKMSINKSWWRKQPFIQEIDAKAIPDNETALASYESKQIDMVSTTILTSRKYKESGDTEIYEYLTQNYDFLAPNLNRTIFQDKKVRQAIAYAIDRKDIISKVYLNHAIAVDVPIPPDSWLYDKKSKIYDYNLDKAKKLLEESGWKDEDGDKTLDKTMGKKKVNFSFTIMTDDDNESPVRKEAAVIIKKQLAKVGIDVTIEAVPWDELMKKIDTKKFDMVLIGYYLDPIPDLSFAFHSNNIKRGKNITSYSDPDTDKLLEDIQSEVDQNRLKDKIMQLQRKLTDDLPYISLYFRTGSLIARNNIKGIEAPREMNIFKTIDQWYLIK